MSDADLEAIASAVDAAERETSGEIRVHLEERVSRPRVLGILPLRSRTPDERTVLARARDVFARLGMTKTRDRNAVLIYVAVEDHGFAIVGDEGVHARVGDAYWDGVRDAMAERLRAGRAREAITGAVADVGRILREHFPPRPDDVDELPDRPSIG
jgi:uncharacterized membrane protein